MIERLAQFIQSQGLSVRAFELSIAASDGMIRRAINNKSDIQSKWIVLIADNYPHLNLDWLILGRGSMLRDSKSEESNVVHRSDAMPVSLTEESIIYKMYQDQLRIVQEEREENKGLLKHIGTLEERIHQLESQDKESGSQSKVDKIAEAFTSDSLGDYGEGSLPTKQPTGSKRSSAGKM